MKRFIHLLLILFAAMSQTKAQSLFEKLAAYNNASIEEAIYIQTDRPFYEINETVWFTVWVRNNQNLQSSEKSNTVQVKFLNPKGQVIEKKSLLLKKGSATSSFRVGKSGGLFTITASSNFGLYMDSSQVVKKEVQVQNVHRTPILFTNDLEKSFYKPGDKVKGIFQMRDALGFPLSNHNVNVTLYIDGTRIKTNSYTTDPKGFYYPDFDLPKNKEIISASFQCQANLHGNPASKFKAIPISNENIDLWFFPEGGYAVNDIETNVAFKAIDRYQNPAPVKGKIMCVETGETVVDFESLHEGMGKFRFKPQSGKSYYALVYHASGAEQKFELPPIQNTGTVLTIDKLESKQLIVSFKSKKNEKRNLALRKGNMIVYSCEFKESLTETLTIPIEKLGIGVHKLTLFDEKMNPIAERIVFLNPHKKLKVEIKTDKDVYNANEKVKMNIQIKDFEGKPVKTQFAMSLMNEQILQYSGKYRENIASSLLLQNELVGEVYNPAYYFSSTEPEVIQNMDLLMLTHGWRRIDWKEIGNKTDSLIDISKHFKGGCYAIVGSLYKHFDKDIKLGTLILKENNQIIPIDANGKFAIWGLKPGVKYDFTFKIKGFHKLKFSFESWEIDTSKLKIRYGVPYKEKVENEFAIAFENRPKAKEFFLIGQNPTGDEKDIIERVAEGINVNGKTNVENVDQQKSSMVYKDIKAIPGLQSSNYRYNGNFSNSDFLTYSNYSAWNRKVYVEQNNFNKIYNQNAKFFYYNPLEEVKYSSSNTNKNTLLYLHEIETDENGKAELTFNSKTNYGSFLSTFEGIGDNGMIAFQTTTITVSKPALVDINFPDYLSYNDKALIPITVINTRNYPQQFNLNITSGKFTLDTAFTIEGKSSFNYIIPQTPSTYGTRGIAGTSINYKLWNEKFVEQKGKYIRIQDNEKRIAYMLSGMGNDQSNAFEIKNEIESNSVTFFVDISKSFKEDILNTAKNLKRQPYGCFEQVSSANYPNLLAWQIMGGNKYDIDHNLKSMISNGYKKLVAYETSEKGFEWYGRNPPHEGLTAYGLLQFYETDQHVFSIDRNMFKRNMNWLKSRFNKDGSININGGKYGFSGASQEVTNAYVTWVLSQIDDENLIKQIRFLEKYIAINFDAYIMALLANIHINIGNPKRGKEILDKLILHVEERNYKGLKASHSITRSNYSALDVECMSLIALALYNADYQTQVADNIISVIYSKFRNSHGYFGSTQSTVLFYKAVLEWIKRDNAVKKISKYMFIDVNGVVIDTILLNSYNPIVKSINSTLLKIGTNHISVRFSDTNSFVYSLQLSHLSTEESIHSEVLKIEGNFSDEVIKRQDYTQINYKVNNLTSQGLGQTVAVIPVAAGLSLIPEQLKLLQDQGKVHFYEIVDDKVYLYWSELGPNETKVIPIGFTATFPGTYFSVGTYVYVYYSQEIISRLGMNIIKIEH